MKLKDVEKLAELARIEMSAEEKKTMLSDFEPILEYVGQIKEANVSARRDLAEKNGQVNIFREDNEPHASGAFTDALLSAVPRKQDGYVKVKKIL